LVSGEVVAEALLELATTYESMAERLRAAQSERRE
jgi:hypothetical protein